MLMELYLIIMRYLMNMMMDINNYHTTPMKYNNDDYFFQT